MTNEVKRGVFGTLVLGLTAALGCSSSSNPVGPPMDSGSTAETGAPVDAGLDAAAVVSCNPTSGRLCEEGQTCCFSGLQGTCVASGSCGTPFNVACIGKSTCSDGDFCCGSVVLPAGFDASALEAPVLDAGVPPFDASSFDASGFGFQLACASTCTAPAFTFCTKAADCPEGQMCGASPYGNGFGLLQACVPVDAGAAAADSGSASGEAGVPDAGP